MTSKIAIDNDVIIKMSCYNLLKLAPQVSGDEAVLGILGAAKYVARDRVNKDRRIIDRSSAIAALEAFLQIAEVLEPTEEEVSVATELERIALDAGVPLDAGESQLCAIVYVRCFDLLVTGDKRAIEAAESLLQVSQVLQALAGRVLCLEQLVLRMIEDVGLSKIRSQVCAEPAMDRALSLILGCGIAGRAENESIVGVKSYIRDLRSKAPTLLYSS